VAAVGKNIEDGRKPFVTKANIFFAFSMSRSRHKLEVVRVENLQKLQTKTETKEEEKKSASPKQTVKRKVRLS
jgi:hypothetical protein